MAIFTEKHMCWRLFFDKFADLWSANLSKRDSNTGVFL